MAALTEFGFELDGYQFGLGYPVFIEQDGWDTGSSDWRVQDSVLPGGDGVIFGQDYAAARTWAFTMHTSSYDAVEAHGAVEAAGAAWLAPGVRSKSGAVSTLRYRIDGRERRVYGRPGRFAASTTNNMLNGLYGINADFRCADGVVYDDVENVKQVGTLNQSQGGLRVPFRVPGTLAITAGTVTQQNIIVGGTRPTWLDVKFSGPVTDPFVLIDSTRRIALRGSVAFDAAVMLSGKPWDRTARYETGGSAVTLMSRETRLASLLITPGEHTVTFGGVDFLGTATAQLSWRNAYVMA